MACSWSFYSVTAVSSFSLTLSHTHTNTFSLLFTLKSTSPFLSAGLLRFWWSPLLTVIISHHMGLWHLKSCEWSIHDAVSDSGCPLWVSDEYLQIHKEAHSIFFALLRIWAWGGRLGRVHMKNPFKLFNTSEPQVVRQHKFILFFFSSSFNFKFSRCAQSFKKYKTFQAEFWGNVSKELG